jgi:DNA primase
VLCFDGDAAGQRAAMRAVTRALPLLRPAHSLRIVRLPAGLDPDDLIKRDGPKAMETVLSGASTLLDTLWQHERDASPLATPEDKAGLKARLMAHVDTIADRDIQGLYRRELLDRFSEFAYPAREKRAWKERPPGGAARGQGGSQGGRFGGQGGGRGFPATPAPSPEHSRRLRHALQGGSRDALTGAIVAGLARWPAQIARHAEALARCGELDPRLEAMLDLADRSEALEPQALATILAQQGISLPGPSDWSDMPFGFLGSDSTPEQALLELAQAVELFVERPALERALADATRRFEQELSDEAYSEQQRLLKRKLEFDARLRQMASARAALPGGSATNTMAE